MRPTRRYEIHFTNPGTPHVIKLIAPGETPCRARSRAFEMLSDYLKLSPELPAENWQLALQSDLGIM